MTIDNALASVAVTDFTKAAAWYAKLLGSAGTRPMPDLAEWSFPRGGGLQVYKAPERAGHCSVTFSVSDIDEQVRKLEAMNVDASRRSSSDRAKTVMVRDPDGNSIAFAQPLDPTLSR